MTTEQIRLLRFDGFKTIEVAKRKTEDRLQKLSTRGKLIRWVPKGEKEYRYSIEEKPAQAEHRVLTNWARLWMVNRLKSWEKLHSFGYEGDYSVLRCDAFATVKNTVTEKFSRMYFVEADRSNNKWDKVVKYNKLFELINSGKFNPWWLKLTERFPAVLCITTSEERKKNILVRVDEENKNGLRFEVMLLDELKVQL